MGMNTNVNVAKEIKSPLPTCPEQKAKSTKLCSHCKLDIWGETKVLAPAAVEVQMRR